MTQPGVRTEIAWPSGQTVVLQNVVANQFIVLQEGKGVTVADPIIFSRAAAQATPVLQQ